MEEEPGKAGMGRQLIGSLLAAALIIALAIWAVTARLGPTSIAEREAAEEQAEEDEEAREEAAEEGAQSRAEGAGESGRNRRRKGRDR